MNNFEPKNIKEASEYLQKRLDLFKKTTLHNDRAESKRGSFFQKIINFFFRS
ncbi:hypothetical protein KKC15_01615 [bacterium]|nr:hypothetical protein [bacterium]